MPKFMFPFWLCVLAFAILLCSLFNGGCSRSKTNSETSTFVARAGDTSGDTSAFEQRTIAFCGHCHAMPSPQTFPKDAWYEEVERGYEFYLRTGRTDLDPPPLIHVVNYFRERAPERLQLPVVDESREPFQRRFVSQVLDSVESASNTPAVTHIHVPSGGAGTGAVLFCDARSGDLRSLWEVSRNRAANSLSMLENPSHVESTDLDANGTPDLVVAELGSIYPADHDRGRVVWLRSDDGRTGWSPVVLKGGLSRVADVRPGDFDGDGRVDLMVAVFGWHTTGEILWLRNTGMNAGTPQFETTVIDSRHGTIHVPTCDLNADGRLDFIALISQEHEVVEAFLNAGDGSFQRQLIFAANDPGFGSSGIELVDLDRDGDLDVLYTNGDSFDSKYLKPSHGVHWLENEGRFPFRDHPLVQLPGAYRALAADFDHDLDLDVIVSAFIPRSQISNAAVNEMTSLLLLEHTDNHQFRKHLLERGKPKHAALGIADADADGDLDIFAGQYASDTMDGQSRLSVWLNQQTNAE